jgi:hypothetical protein
MSTTISEGHAVSVDAAMLAGRQRSIVLNGQLDNNQGCPTFTGRMTLEQLADITVAHNKKWAEEAGESMDQVTQREIIDAHANGLAIFMLQGLVDATLKRSAGDPVLAPLVDHLRKIQHTLGKSMHYGLPPVTLVLPRQPEIKQLSDSNGQVVGARMIVPAGVFFYVADGQHRREAARRVRVFLNELIANRRAPKGNKIYQAPDGPIAVEEIEAWSAVQETFRGWTVVSYEAHIGLDVPQARQMFTNYNCHVKPVKADINLQFDQSNPINSFGKDLLENELRDTPGWSNDDKIRQVAAINGFLFLGKTTIKSAPFNVSRELPIAKEFWTYIVKSKEWSREDSLLHEIPVLKGLAKAWFYVFIAKRNKRDGNAADIRSYIDRTTFDKAWAEGVDGLMAHTVASDNAVGFRFSPAHNDIVGKIVAHVLPERATR